VSAGPLIETSLVSSAGCAVRIPASLRADPVKRPALTVSSAMAGVIAGVVLWSLEPRLAFPSLRLSDRCQLLSTTAIGVLSIIGV